MIKASKGRLININTKGKKMKKIRRNVKHYSYSFGKVNITDDSNTANITEMENVEKWGEPLSRRERSKFTYNGYVLLDEKETDIMLEADLEKFVEIAEITEV